MQRAVSVQRLHVVLDNVVPLHAQVDEASGLDLFSFPVENVMPRRLVLDCCNQSFGYEPLTEKCRYSINYKSSELFTEIKQLKLRSKKGVIHGICSAPGTRLE